MRKNMSPEERERLWLYTGHEEPEHTGSYYANRHREPSFFSSFIGRALFPTWNYPPSAARKVALTNVVKLVSTLSLLIALNHAKDSVPVIKRIDDGLNNIPAVSRVLTVATNILDYTNRRSPVIASADDNKGPDRKGITKTEQPKDKEPVQLSAIDDARIRKIISDREKGKDNAEEVITVVNGVEVNKEYSQVPVAKYALIYNTGDAFKYLGSITYKKPTTIKGGVGVLGYIVTDDDGSTVSEVYTDVEDSIEADELDGAALKRIEDATDFVVFNVSSDDAGEISALPFPSNDIDTQYTMEPNETSLVLGFRIE